MPTEREKMLAGELYQADDPQLTTERAHADRLLRAFATALAGTVRETDVAGRVGGDEFAALLLAAGPGDVGAFVARLRDGLPEGLAVSAGAAHLPEECSAAEQLLQTADRRLYSDKTARAA